ncbi:hypothetical protein [Xenorhabdus sp. PB30.3]|uniref:hypothetical protein n=1 Tax=Xenorhabdus sp. PB30.3 TaxID=2788941 RepID=UPI001E5247B8|nr:hypothetical protein [Xenorhabdus sp. PB30.3]MCC8379104.1 hypothetical protein [Xenorhabdus sp. PB30.3]
MKILLSVIIMLIFISKPASTYQDFILNFENKDLVPINMSVYDTQCVEPIDGLVDVPLYPFPPHNTHSWSIRDINSGLFSCFLKQKRVTLKISKTIAPARLDHNACLLIWANTLYYGISNSWQTAFLTNCDFVKEAICTDPEPNGKSKPCLNYCPDLTKTANNCPENNYISGINSYIPAPTHTDFGKK